jgi:ribosome-associated toxin RatA of RatAB toxin-antitoxin module
MNTDLNATSSLSQLDLTDVDLADDDQAESHEDLEVDHAALQAVEVKTDWVEGRERQISARILIPYAVDQVWQILTDYEHLADFIPSLAKSHRLPHPEGGIRIEQVGTQAFLKLKFCARVVLDMVEQFPHQLDFRMVEGDFKAFSGSWQLHPLVEGGTDLCYTVRIKPLRMMPIGMIERRLSHNLAINLTAIQQRAEAIFGSGIELQ